MLNTSTNPKKHPAELARAPASPLRPNAAVFSPLLSPRMNGGFAVPPSPRFGAVGGESIDQWFRNLRKYEATLGAMAAASEEPKFREELGTIEQWFTLLTESEQTASLYTLLQHANQEQLTFLKAILQQLSENGENSRQNSPANTRPPKLNIRLPGTPGTPAFSLTQASPSSSGKESSKESAKESPKASNILSPLSATEGAQDIFIKPAEERISWANMVNTPMDLMFQKPQSGGIQGVMSPTMGMPMMNPFNPGMMGYSNEAQMLALQLVMSGMVGQQPLMNPPQKSPHQQRQQKQSSTSGSNNWRAGSSRPGNSRTSSGSKAKSTASPSSAAASKPEDDVDPKLLEDIPAWLKSLRLHKYTECFTGMTWQEVVQLDEAALEAKGVTALGARRRLTKNFDAVKRKMGMSVNPEEIPAEES
ncbi:Flap-structured DNA-binding and RNA-binding protein [Paramarasmius palmivorus]|uniref:Flap-structured DNA-binding and RNA-binding protein n=1 Tax=Paramarasmius palmivorus TaxID=297713 RepID=A0AAW0D698_9AGAR